MGHKAQPYTGTGKGKQWGSPYFLEFTKKKRTIGGKKALGLMKRKGHLKSKTHWEGGKLTFV